MKRLTLIVGLVSMNCSILFGQQETQVTQYLDNMLYYNPAYAGSSDQLSLGLISRAKWAGVDGAPRTQFLTANTPTKYKSLGVGFSLMNDVAGPLRQNWINIDASYALQFDAIPGKIYLGMKGGLNFLNAEFTSLLLDQSNDPAFGLNYSNRVLPNLGAGIYYRSEKYFAGISIPRMVENKDQGQLEFQDQKHIYISGGTYIDLNRMWKVRPSALIKWTSNAPLSFDLTSTFIMYDQFFFGLNYRVQDSFGFMAQFLMRNSFRVGYSYDMSTTPMARSSNGSHELVLVYDFYFRKGQVTGPRLF
jgi:type IX secretion system PorP/SprF family membrane protein